MDEQIEIYQSEIEAIQRIRNNMRIACLEQEAELVNRELKVLKALRAVLDKVAKRPYGDSHDNPGPTSIYKKEV